MNKVLILTNHRKGRSPGQRFRFEQYLEFLEDNNFEVNFSYLLNEWDDKHFYNKSSFFSKVYILLKSYIKRYIEVRSYNQYDVVFIYREAFFTGTTYFERKVAQSKAKLIFDFDDSIWLNDVSEGNKKWEWLKNENKTKEIIGVADLVFVGNQYLVDYVKQFNNNVKLIPTTIETSYHYPNKDGRGKICIGWTGSSTTLKYFEDVIPILLKIKNIYGDKVSFRVIVDVEKYYNEIDVKTTPWSLSTEIEELNKIDIGIMPLPDDEWAKGKCGFKGLQYMALEIPAIMSPVGVNNEIIENGVNGFLADTKEEWVTVLSNLIESKSLRKEIGVNARNTVVEKYSMESQKMNYLNEFQKLIS
jgi:glycosyltransferase involved in cell wall biosynthesis